MANTKKNFYRCDNGHDIASTKTIKKCLAIVRGSPCTGKVRPVDAAGRRARRASNDG